MNNVHFQKKPLFPFQTSYPMPENTVNTYKSEHPSTSNADRDLFSWFH